jgi:hypothetical protein
VRRIEMRELRPELDKLCPYCDSKSYGGGSTPRVKDGLVYRRRLCLDEKCAREFVTVEGVISGNTVLTEFLELYHDVVLNGDPFGLGKKELLS